MSFNPFKSLTGRLLLVTITALAVSHAIAFALFASERQHSFRAAIEDNVVDRAASLIERLSQAPLTAQEGFVAARGARMGRYAIVDHAPEHSSGLAGIRIARAISAHLDGAQVRVVETRIEHDAREREPRGEQAFDRPDPRFGSPMRRREHMAPRFDTQLTIYGALGSGRWLRMRAFVPPPSPMPATILFATLGSLIAVGAGAALVSQQIGKPLAQLARAAERLGHGETNVSAPVSGPDDVQRASRAFNDMATRLGRQIERQRQMLWALSHDLRTPITALKLRAELIDDDAARARLLAPVDEIAQLTEQALALARAGASREARTRVDVAEIARTLCGELAELGFNVRAEANTPVFTECAPGEIARAMRNLAENAARHGGGGVVTVVQSTNGGTVIEVTDEGGGVAPDVLARLTEPFFRAEASRTDGASTGLGLAITQAIAEAHGGRLELANRVPRGFSAKIVLPD